MIDKTPIGIGFFDSEYGGVYRHRTALITGRAGSGKTMLALQFLAQGLRLQERGLILSTHRAQDLAIKADTLGVPVTSAIESGDLNFLEYSEFVPGRDSETSMTMPPDGFAQLREIIETHAVQRVVFDSVLPWISLPDSTHIAQHIFSLVRAIERMNVTALFTLPKPVSPAAIRLRKLLEDNLPVSISLTCDSALTSREWLVGKYIGMTPSTEGIPFVIDGRKGFLLGDENEAPEKPSPSKFPVHSTAPSAASKPKSSFASLVLDQLAAGHMSPGAPATASARRG